MIPLRKVLVHPGIVHSERVCALPVTVQLFFRNLLHCCDGAARFVADPAELRYALYQRAPGVASSHVEAWLIRCHQARLVKLYTRDGKGYGEVLNYRQTNGKQPVLYPAPPEEDGREAELGLGLPEAIASAEDSPDDEPAAPRPPPPPNTLKNRIEGKGKAAAPAAFFETQEAWLQRITADWPSVNIPKQLKLAEADRRAKGKDLEREWFETRWLTKTSPIVRLDAAAAPAAAIPAEPEGWRVYLKDEYYDESWAESAAACTWTTLPANWRDRILREYSPPHRRSQPQPNVPDQPHGK